MLTAYRDDNLQLAWDSTSFHWLIECPRKYYYYNQAGYRGKTTNPHLTFGQFYHSACEAYDHAKAEGKDHEAALLVAVRRVFTDCFLWKSDHTYKNPTTLLRTVVWYLDSIAKNDPAKTVILENGKPAVELSFRFQLDLQTEQGEEYFYSGHIDRLAEIQGSVFVFDRKTTKNSLNYNFFQQFSPHHQLPGYDIAGKIVYKLPTKGVIVDGAQVLVEGSRFARAPISYTQPYLEEWFTGLKHYIKLAETYHRSNYWPMNPASCHKYNGCEFRDVCSKAPSIRQSVLDGDFKIDRWDPLKVRGDI